MSSYTDDDDLSSIVLDNGSGTLKAGFAGDDSPRAVFSTVVGRPRFPWYNLEMKEAYVGDEAQAKRELLSIRYPIEHGIVTNWDDMELIWDHMFHKELRVKPRSTVYCALNQQVMLESFNVPGFYPAISGLLSIYGSGRGSAIAVDCGEGVTTMVPVYEGYTFPHAIQRIDMGGREITNFMARLLAEKGYSFSTIAELELVKKMKEKYCYTPLNFEEEVQQNSISDSVKNTYELPDGTVVKLGDEIFKATEPFFQPSLIGIDDEPGIQHSLYKALNECDIDTRRDLCCSIILSGASTMTRGFQERMQKEMTKLMPKNLKIKIIAPPERKFLVWIGGSILASLSTFQQLWVTKEEYEEFGPSIVHRKCF